MAGHFFTTIENTITGKPVANATLEVFTSSAIISGSISEGYSVTGTYATIFSDDGVTQVDQDDEPVTSNSNGYVEFWTNETSVVLLVSYDGVGKMAISDVEIVGGSINSDLTALSIRVDNLETNVTNIQTDITAIELVTQDPMIADIAGLSDPNADRILFWDDSDGHIGFLTVSTGLSISGTSLTCTVTEASAAEVWAGSSTTKFISPDKLFDAAAPQTLTDGATVTPDFGAGINFEWTMGASRNLANPSNAKAGQSGTITITQDATGGRVVTYGSNYRFPGGSAVGGVLSTAANSVDIIAYKVRADGTTIDCVLSKAFAA